MSTHFTGVIVIQGREACFLGVFQNLRLLTDSSDLSHFNLYFVLFAIYVRQMTYTKLENSVDNYIRNQDPLLERG